MPRGSIWLDGLPDLGAPRVDSDLDCDVAVVGGGIAGLLTAERLSAADADVVVVEADRIAHGVTGYTTGKVTTLHQNSYSKIGDPKRGQLYAAANRAGLDRIAALVASEEIACDFERRDAVIFAECEAQVDRLESELEAARAAGLVVLNELESGLPTEAWGAIRMRGQAQFNAAKFADGLARRLIDRGVRIFEHSRVLELSERGSGASIDTADGTVRADHVVIASHYPFADRGGFFTRLDPQRSYCIAAEIRGDAPEDMYISAGSPTHSVRTAVPAKGGKRRLVVGGGGHRAGSKSDPRRSYSALEEWTREHFDIGPVTHSWSAQDEMTRDHLPDVGRLHPRSDRVFVITGFNKWGLAISASAAVEIEHLCLGRKGPWSEIFGPWNGVSVGGLAEVTREGAKFAERLVRGHLLDRDAPVCTHMGCRLSWNDAEETWDCGCHGSRFAADGAVLEGPATRPIEVEANVRAGARVDT